MSEENATSTKVAIEAALKEIRFIASTKYGAQGIMEDYSDVNAFNYHMKEYYRHLANSYQSAARRAIEAFETFLEAEENGTADTALIHPIRDQDRTMPAPKVMGRLRLRLVDGKTVREQLD